ncbi:alpha-L-rhamnosidase [Reticulibacter mediterranei]|uniref:alpha-L-rhamnosidase n=1 Tax=Reticulibacter mediterranei TaxID=2778369 RepID=A0A8J3ISN7_9CHLR|nr:glycoside hydrolase family 78 protein [Reticulibacter mediterranei]GHO99738.1 alpha-L-rhamnosidase [Reticulibacter mediterranei]
MSYQEPETLSQEIQSERPTIAITSLRFEYFHYNTDALGIGTARPRVSWIVEAASANWYQTAYEMELYDAAGVVCGRTGRVSSEQSVFVEWPFEPLHARERVSIRVRVWGTDEQPSQWSNMAAVEVGLLHPDDWIAQFVTPAWEADVKPSPLLRREFEVSEGVSRARLYITSLGVYEAQINGQVVGDHVLAPGWTVYPSRLLYQTFDVTDLLQPGRNAIGALLADGWYRGRLGFGDGQRNIYGDRLALLAQLEITYEDGRSERIVTDQHWRAATGPILDSSLYDGETYDARLERSGWSAPGYDDCEWAAVQSIEQDLTTLAAPIGPPVRHTGELSPVAIITSPSGRTILDFGQNLVGRLRLIVRGEAGQKITLRHAEVLENGELGTRPLRTAKATDQYVLRGEGEETWEPRFTFHGFRYAEVEGWPGELNCADIVAVVCHSDMERTGWFECSDPLLSHLHENVVWSMRGNFFSIPTDCPQRDERLGWTGDIQVFAPAASFLYDTAGFLASWLRDLEAEQKASGMVPYVVPNILPHDLPDDIGGKTVPTAAWGDAAVLVPWTLYQRYGNMSVLETQFESMRAWVDLLTTLTGERLLWDSGFQFGDWLDPSAPTDNPSVTRTDPAIVATAYFARSAEILGRAAEVLGRDEDAVRYLALAARIRDAFDAEYVTDAGRVLSDSETAYALMLQFDLLKREEQRRHAGQQLAQLVRQSGYHINTGFVGTPLICDALCAVGEYEVAYRLLMQRECPSWLYAVTMGATTIWERWDSMLPDGSINPGDMTSFNHYAFGAVADWLHRVVAGLAPAEPGYRRLTIAPHPGGNLTHARASLRTLYGLAESAWVIENGEITLKVTVPPNTTASVIVPGRSQEAIVVGSGMHVWSVPYSSEKRGEA